MVAEMKKQSIVLNQNICEKNEAFQEITDIIIPDIKPDILNIITTNGIVCIEKMEIFEGIVAVNGKVELFVTYFPDDEKSNIRALNTVVDFNHKFSIKEAKENMNLNMKIDIKNIETKILNGRKINVKINMQNHIKITTNKEIEILNKIENIPQIQCLENQKEINILLGVGEAKTFAKETISLNEKDVLSEILQLSTDIINKEVKISYNKVLVKAEVKFRIMYLNDKNEICNLESCVPIMGFVDLNNVTEQDIVNVNMNVRNILINTNSKEESSIYVEEEVDFYVEVFQTKQLKIIEDMYIPFADLEYKTNSVNIESGRKQYKEKFNIKQKIDVKLNGNEIFNKEIIPKINKIEKSNDKFIYEGDLDIRLITNIQNSKNIDIKNIVIPFNLECLKKVKNNKKVDIKIEVKKQDIEIINNENMNIDVELEFDIIEYNIENLNIIGEVKVNENKKNKKSSLVIYIVKKDDTLWKIAKQLGSTIEDITELNNIEDKNNIIPGRKLYVPKYINKVSFD